MATVVRGELRLLDPAVRASAEAAELLDAEFREFGASGHTWGRASILAAMAERPGSPPAVEDLAVARVGADVLLVTYRQPADGAPANVATPVAARRPADGAPASVATPVAARRPADGAPATVATPVAGAGC